MLRINLHARTTTGPPAASAGTIPKELGNLGALEKLWLWDNKLSGGFRGVEVKGSEENMIFAGFLCRAGVVCCPSLFPFEASAYVALHGVYAWSLAHGVGI